MDNRLKDRHLVDELPTTFLDVEQQLKKDDKRWGDEWKERGLVHNGQDQETRWFYKMQDYFEDYKINGTPIPWLKVIGESHICLVRERTLKNEAD